MDMFKFDYAPLPHEVGEGLGERGLSGLIFNVIYAICA
jgi:hypothetical protein